MDWPDEDHILRIPDRLLTTLDRPTDTSSMRLARHTGEDDQ